jgi:hypothetical protein
MAFVPHRVFPRVRLVFGRMCRGSCGVEGRFGLGRCAKSFCGSGAAPGRVLVPWSRRARRATRGHAQETGVAWEVIRSGERLALKVVACAGSGRQLTAPGCWSSGEARWLYRCSRARTPRADWTQACCRLAESRSRHLARAFISHVVREVSEDWNVRARVRAGSGGSGASAPRMRVRASWLTVVSSKSALPSQGSRSILRK